MGKVSSFFDKLGDMLVEFIMFMWQLPQNVLGVLSLFIYQPVHILTARNGVRVCYTKKLESGAFTLGQIAVLPIRYYRQDATDALELKYARHEWRGHGAQSCVLGWLYIPVIAIPSAVHALIHGDKVKDCKDKPYEHFYTERWAEKWA